ncbi:MAG: CCA tRNA nucleotidyltransferase [Firmicutes bacterium]|nr:CCA tRNA nucleotidyltransferase [Bacillota bacterium]
MLVKLPKEVGKILTRLSEAGYEAYVVGDCVRDSVLGRKPFAWDLSTNADLNQLKEVFPEADVLSEKFSVIRLEYIEEILDKDGDVVGETGIIADIGTYRSEGKYENGRPTEVAFVGTIQEDLARKDFTINAIADSQQRFIDMYEGREDLRKKLIRTIKPADECFKEDPVRMLRAIRLAAELQFDLHKSVHEAILANANLLENVSKNKVRDEFTMLMNAVDAGKGLKMLIDMGLLWVVLGHNMRLTGREKSDLLDLCRGINLSQQVEERRLGLFFTCIDRKKIRPVIESLNFDEVTETLLLDAVNDLPKFYFINNKTSLKQFLYQKGWDRYNYLTNMEKAQRIVFGYDSETKIKSKMYMLEEVLNKKEAIFLEDLVVDANDLVEAGACPPERAEKILSMLMDEIHTHPLRNTRTDLLRLAEMYNKNKFAAMLRGVKWNR